MRVRLFEAVGPDYKGLTDIESEHLPAVGDLLSVEYGDAVYRIYRVIGRTLRVYAVKGKVYSVALWVEQVEDLPSNSWISALDWKNVNSRAGS